MALPFLPAFSAGAKGAATSALNFLQNIGKKVEDVTFGALAQLPGVQDIARIQAGTPLSEIIKEPSFIRQSNQKLGLAVEAERAEIRQRAIAEGLPPHEVEKRVYSTLTKAEQEEVFGAVAGFAGGMKDVAGELPEKAAKLIKESVAGITKKTTETVVNNAKTTIQKLRQAVAEAKPIREEKEVLMSKERTLRAGLGEKELAEQTGQEAFIAARQKLKGKLPVPETLRVETEIGLDDMEALVETIRVADLPFYTKVNLEEALRKITGAIDDIPTKGEIRLLEDFFGKEAVVAMNQKVIKPGIADYLNIPRTLLSSFDLSVVLRQGLPLITRKPLGAIPALRRLFLSWGDEKFFAQVQEEIANRPLAELSARSGLFLPETAARGAGILQREEAFLSNLVQKWPILGPLSRRAERANIAFLNKMRADIFDDAALQFIKSGITPESDPGVFRQLAEYVNTLSGRGSLGVFNRAAPILSAALFSPRLMASRFQILNPLYYAKMERPVRIEAIKGLLSLAGTVVSLLSFASLAGADVESDPRSTDFGKVRSGNIRWDIAAGFQQYLRLFAQLILGETKSSTTGKVYSLTSGKFPYTTRLDLIYRFFEGKLAPVPALAADLARGSDIVGEKVTVEKALYEKTVVLFLQDLIDAYGEVGVEAALTVGVPGFFGIGTQVYKDQKKQSAFGQGLPSLPALPSLPSFPSL